jgi:hypothetical protein
VVDYGVLDRTLHRAALQFGPLAELWFDLDQAMNRLDPQGTAGGRHIFVTGLARAGTTILMRRIYATGTFCSLTYRDMPFVLAPNLWSLLTKVARRTKAPAERAHGDGILVDIDSPESLDEVFWRIFSGDDYIGRTHLRPYEPDAETMAKYAAYVAAILKADPERRPRYLAKNNNNILRLGSIRRAFPEAVILIAFRDPLAHAASLLHQHWNFNARQQEHPFVRSYMTWLGHHEFGLDHRPFRFSEAGAGRLAAHRPDRLEYWLEIWCQTYDWLAKSAPRDAVFVCYEQLCQDTAVWKRLEDICRMEIGDREHERFVIKARVSDASLSATRLADQSRAIYAQLVARAQDALGADGPPTCQDSAGCGEPKEPQQRYRNAPHTTEVKP